jgi:hypothetical protein
MKVFLFTALLLFHTDVFSQTDSLHVYDTLAKYSYVLLGLMQGNNLGHFPIVGNATGFFVRTSNKLYLISAYHVFTSCEVYQGIFEDIRSDYLLVQYHDTLGNKKTQMLPLKDYKNMPCIFFLDHPDIDTMDVTNYFKDGVIYSVEKFFPQKSKKKKAQVDENKFICYGFPGKEYFESIFKTMNIDHDAFSYFGTVADSNQYEPYYKIHNIDSMYITIQPALFGGTSGSPIFKVQTNKKKEQKVVFAGIQSGTNAQLNCSYIVKSGELIKLFVNQLK